MRSGGSVAVSLRTPTCATEARSDAARPTSATGRNSPGPGLSTSAMPRKPTSSGCQSALGRRSPNQILSTMGRKRGSE